MSAARPLTPAAQARAAWPFALCTLIWGSTWIVIRAQLGPVPSGWSVCYRFVAGSLTMFAVAAATRTPLAIGRRGQGLALLLGCTMFSGNFNLVYRAEAHVTSGIVAVTYALLVVYNAVLARIFLRQPVSRPFLAGSAVAMGGVALLFVHEFRAGVREGSAGGEAATGIGLTLAAMLFASVANVLQGSALARRLAMPSVLAWGMAWGALVDAALAWAQFGPPVAPPDARYVACLLYLGVVASALGFTLYFGLIRRIGPARAGYVNVLVPVLAMLFSTVFERYRWSLEAVAGAALVMLGLVVATRARSPTR